jgi:hypothetical protein
MTGYGIRRFIRVYAMSADPAEADINRRAVDVREVPLGDIPRRRKTGSADKPLCGQLRISPAEDRSRAVCACGRVRGAIEVIGWKKGVHMWRVAGYAGLNGFSLIAAPWYGC